MFNWLEWFGYLASFIILISLVMSSIIKLRWINLIGSIMFTFYGFLIGSIPVGVMNCGIVTINIYYLVKIYGSKESFLLLEFEKKSHYLHHFINFYKDDMKKYTDHIDVSITENTMGFYILRNMVTTGIFKGTKINSDSLMIDIDYAVPAYRDFKIGHYLYVEKKDLFKSKGLKNMYARSSNPAHTKYLLKMGFKKIADGRFLLEL